MALPCHQDPPTPRHTLPYGGDSRGPNVDTKPATALNSPPSQPSPHLRVHGPDRAEIELETGGTWNKIVEPRDDALRAATDITRQNVEAGADTYVNVDNHYEGSAPVTVRRVVGILGKGLPG
jgi:hypothetical protein